MKITRKELQDLIVINRNGYNLWKTVSWSIARKYILYLRKYEKMLCEPGDNDV